LEVSEATAYLQGRVGEMVPGLAPPHGLSLVEVKYSEKNLETDRNY
jgi:tRNA U38,U39,U40 pseudouridine synthase TruA